MSYTTSDNRLHIELLIYLYTRTAYQLKYYSLVQQQYTYPVQCQFWSAFEFRVCFIFSLPVVGFRRDIDGRLQNQFMQYRKSSSWEKKSMETW